MLPSMQFPLFILSILSLFSLIAAETIWDYSPDTSSDPFPPYPSLLDANGKNITLENLRGTRLYGWKGCQKPDRDIITQAYNDFYTLANNPAVYNNIDWNSQAAKDFWGPADGPYIIPADTRKEIQQIFAAAQQLYYYSWIPLFPWEWWKSLWIEVRCSDSTLGPKTSDPNNACGDAKPNKGKCPSKKKPVGGKKKPVTNQLEAFTDPKSNRITFCKKFFALPTLDEATIKVKKMTPGRQVNLLHWKNRARVFFHEATHLDWFMNAGAEDKGLSPFVSDLEIKYAETDEEEWHDAYGPYKARILTNWRDDDPKYSAYFTQRNADSYAFFALAKYVEKEIGKYPSEPSTGGKSPVEEPRDARTHLAPEVNGYGGDPPEEDSGEAAKRDGGVAADGNDDDEDPDEIGCGDKVGLEVAQADTLASLSSAHTSKPTSAPGPPKSDPKCDKTALSGIPYNVFSGKDGSVFGNFCDSVGKAQRTKLTWNVDSSGKEKSLTRRHWDRRTPPPNPSAYGSYTFELDWAPTSGDCNTGCKDAYSAMATSPCGHQGGEQNGMTASASLDVGCGAYSYKISGSDVPAPEGPPAPTVSAQYCFPDGVFGDHGDIEPDWQAKYTGFACGGSAKKNFEPGDKFSFNTTTNDVPYNYNIWWTDGCTSTVNPMNVYQPLEGNKDANCMDMMQNNFNKCYNGGIGGSISVGCLTYEFKASMSPAGNFS